MGDRWREGLALINLSNIAIDQGDYSRANHTLSQALALFREINDPNGEGITLALAGKVNLQLGRFTPALDRLHTALAKFKETNHSYSMGLCLAYTSLTAAYQGNYEMALDYGRQAKESAEATENRPVLSTAYAAIGLAHLLSGSSQESQNAFRRTLELRVEIGEELAVIEAAAGLALALLANEETAAALPLAEQILDFLHRRQQPTDDTTIKNGHPLDGAENPSFVYLACYKALAANGDERAAAVLQSAHTLLHQRANRILDETLRRPYLQNVPFNRDILMAYKKTVRNEELTPSQLF
jgi:tetratricopeptide (TPR) repeat protein